MLDKNDDDALSNKFTEGFVVLLSLALGVKLFMIHYGLPFQTHVDESMILRDPFKILMAYSEGDLSKSTNLYNWMLTAWFAGVFFVGLIGGRWHGVEDFKTFMISDSPDFTLYGRLFSVCLSMVGLYFLLKLLCEVTPGKLLRWLFGIAIVLNPIELNSTNWVKFDAAIVLPTAVILLLSHRYFICQQLQFRRPLYLVMILAIAVRIDMCAFLFGVGFFDFFMHRQLKDFKTSLMEILPMLIIGTVVYSLITLAPISFVYSRFFSSTAPVLNTSPTFENAITSKINLTGNMLQLFLGSSFYLKCLFASLGPFVLLMLFFRANPRAYGFVVFPLVLLLLVLIIFPVKNVHYLLTVSIVILYASMLATAEWYNAKQRVAIAMFNVVWIATFTLNQVFVLLQSGDVRVAAREYILKQTTPDDTLYVDGIFSQIFDKRARYGLRAEAAKQSGSTGLGNEYLSQTLDDNETRCLKLVSDWKPFGLPAYDTLFVNPYDTSMLIKDNPEYYIYVGSGLEQTDFVNGPGYWRFQNFYRFLSRHYKAERQFSYQTLDPRLGFANYYYFHPVILYRRRV